MEIRPTHIDDLPKLADFLAAGGTAVSPDTLAWKYFAPAGAGRRRPRSFVAYADGQIVGHIGVIFTELCAPAACAAIDGGWFTDWMVREHLRSRGIGIFLLRRAAETCRCLMTIQGSAQTRSALEQLNWTRHDALAVYKLNLRAGAGRGAGGVCRQVAVELARLVRYHAVAHPAPSGWCLAELPDDRAWHLLDKVMDPLQAGPGGSCSYCLRSGDSLRWFLRDCPSRSYRPAIVFEDDRPSGYAIWRVLERADGRRDARIVDLALPPARPEAWRWLVSAVTGRLAGEGIAQVSCLAGTAAPLGEALAGNRYLPRQALPLWTCPQASEEMRDIFWHLTFADSDIDTSAEEPAPVAKEHVA